MSEKRRSRQEVINDESENESEEEIVLEKRSSRQEFVTFMTDVKEEEDPFDPLKESIRRLLEERRREQRIARRENSKAKQRQTFQETFVNDPYYQTLYEEALLEGTETDNTIRVNVVGNFAQGKTSLTNSLVGRYNECVQSTNGVEINHCKYSDSNDDVVFETSIPFDETKHLNRIAMAVQKKNKAREEDLRDPELQAKTFQRIPSSSSKPSNIMQPTADTESVAERDLKEPKTQVQDKIYAKQSLPSQKTRFSLSETELLKFKNCIDSNNSKINLDGNLEIWDFAGQFVFYATHTLFHSKRAIYLLVFDLTKSLSTVVEDSEDPLKDDVKTMEQYIKFWMNSIHSFVGSDDSTEPKVILVGTHKDQLQGNEEEKGRLAEVYFENIRTMFENTPILNHIHDKDFAVNCIDPEDKEIIKLRKEIIRTGMEYASNNVPARWIPLERELFRMKQRKIITFNQVMKINSNMGLPLEEEQLKLFLLYHHTKGTIFFFDEKQLSGYVVLDTQFLIDAFKCIITSGKKYRKEVKNRSLWKSLREEAKLDMELIDLVWGQDDYFSKHKTEILMFMEKHLIISQVTSYDEDNGTSDGLCRYVVPSFLRDPRDNDAIKEFCRGKKQTSLRFVMSFHISPIVQIIYHRLIAALITKWSVIQIGMPNKKKELLLFKHLVVFRLDEWNGGAVELRQNNIDMRIISLCISHSDIGHTADKFRRFAESVVINEFKKLRQSQITVGKPFETRFRCNNESHGQNGGQQLMLLENLEGKYIKPCPDMTGCHDVYPTQSLSEWFEETSNLQMTKDCQFDDKQLSRISTTIGKEWEILGTELGLHDVQLEHIEMDNRTTLKRIYKMLKLWVAEKKENATVNTLIQAMKSAKKVTIYWDEVRNIIEEIASKQ